MIVRAREKPFIEQPDWAVCCERMRAQYSGDVELLVDTRVFLADTTCPFCGRIEEDTRYMRIVKVISGDCPRKATVIAVDCYELDEGATAELSA